MMQERQRFALVGYWKMVTVTMFWLIKDYIWIGLLRRGGRNAK